MLKYVKHFFVYVLKVNFELQIISLLLFIILLFISLWKYRKKKITISRGVAFVVLPVYVFLILSSLVLSRTRAETIRINFIPFWTEHAICSGEIKYVRTLIQNLLMLVPFGVLFPVLTNMSMGITALSGLSMAVVIEVLQLITKTGLCEVDDVIHNTLGVIIGYGVYYVAIMICKKWRSCCEGKRERKVEDEEII